MQNLPGDLTEDSLMVQLDPFMKDLRIRYYNCEKSRKKPHGTIVFLYRDHGERFLQRHGLEPAPPTGPGRSRRFNGISHLQIMGKNVYCQPGNRAPSEIALKSLQHMMEEQKDPSSNVIEEDSSSVYFSLVDFGCGYCDYVDGKLGYYPEMHWRDGGIVKFTKRNMIAKLDRHVLIRIPLILADLLWSRDGSLTMSLSTVPFFFSEEEEAYLDQWEPNGQNKNGKNNKNNKNNHNNRRDRDGPARKRLCSLGGKHTELAGRCMFYRFRVSTLDIGRKMQTLKTLCDQLTVTAYEIPIFKVPPPDLGEATVQFQELSADLSEYTKDNSLPFEMLFQLQALAYNACLHPGKVRLLARKLRVVFAERKEARQNPLPIDAVKRLFDIVGKPSPDNTEEDFRIDTLMSSIMRNEQKVIEGLAHRKELYRQTENLTFVHRINVTPTGFTLHGPEMEPLNRILRKYPNHHNFFLRIQFSDENGTDLFFNQRVSHEDIFARFKSILTGGIQIAGRVYTFLGFSHSSLRSHSAWVSLSRLPVFKKKKKKKVHTSYRDVTRASEEAGK